MADFTQTWLWIGFVGMVAGAVIFALQAIAWRRKEEMEFPLVSFFITLWAATLYLTMIMGETVLHNFNGQSEIFVGRYIDWSVTTPLLLLDLGVIAGARPKLIAGIMGADVFMIITGAIGALEDAPKNYLWYVISSGAFIAILWALTTEFAATARRRNARVNKLFQKQRNVLIVLWLIYPIVWILGPEGTSVINLGTETVLYTLLDLSAKVGYGLLLTTTPQDILAQASNSELIMETVHSYMDEEPIRRR